MTLDDRTSIVASVSAMLGDLQQAQQLPIFSARRLIALGGHTMALLALSNWLHEDMLIERRGGRLDAAADLGVRAAELSELALLVLEQGGWSAVIDDASPNERVAWNDALEAIRTAHQLEKPRPVPRGVELEVDMSGKVMTIRMDLSALVDDWSLDRVVAPGEHNDGWPIVSGRIYGDLNWEDGRAVTMYGVISADERALIGMSMDCVLGRKAERAP